MNPGRVLLRGIVGSLFIGHGTQKLFGWFQGHGLEWAVAQLGAAIAGSALVTSGRFAGSPPPEDEAHMPSYERPRRFVREPAPATAGQRS